MNKIFFIELLKNAEEDEYGNLYVKEELFANKNDMFYEDNKNNKWYFSLTNTVCDDLIKEHCSQDNENNFEIYDRHFWNDDTLQIKIINNK